MPETQLQRQQQNVATTTTTSVAANTPPIEGAGMTTVLSSPQLRWMCAKPANKEQPEWVRPKEEDGNVMPSSIQRMKATQQPQLSMQQSQQQQQQQPQGFGQRQQMPSQQQQLPRQEPQKKTQYVSTTNNSSQQSQQTPNMVNFGAQAYPSASGLRLQITIPSSQFMGPGPIVR